MELFDLQGGEPALKKKGGPPNRINDLNYTEWMKFQKSFFRELPIEALYKQMVSFFTKEKVNQETTRSIVYTFQQTSSIQIDSRIIEVIVCSDVKDLLKKQAQNERKVSFILIDFRAIQKELNAETFLSDDADPIYAAIQNCLISEGFCCSILDLQDQNGGGFPIAWSLGMRSRKYLRLKDEKVSINENTNSIAYCIISQNVADERPNTSIGTNIDLKPQQFKIPNFCIPKPPPRNANEILHPAKYPETLISQFINTFCSKDGWVFDPMVGTGSTVVAAIKENRNSVGIELSEEFARISRNRASHAKRPLLYDSRENLVSDIIQGDATKLRSIDSLSNRKFGYVVTSPPYWSMLMNKGSENQKKRRDSNLKTQYSDSEKDLGNITDYDVFLDCIAEIYFDVFDLMDTGAFLTIVVKNVKRNHILHTLAWDLVERLTKPKGKFSYVGNTLWLQDDINLKPFGVGTHWVSNILHHYCLHFRRPQ